MAIYCCDINLGLFLKALLFLILSVVLFKFNLNPELQLFRQGETTFGTHYEVSEMIQVPNMMIIDLYATWSQKICHAKVWIQIR